MVSRRARVFAPPRFPSGMPEMTKSGFSTPFRPNSESRFAAEPVNNSTLPLRPAAARLRLWSLAKVGLISHARIRVSGHLAANRKVRAPLPAPSSMTCPPYAAGTGAIIFAMRNLCEGTMPPVCPCFTRPAQKKCRYVAAVLDIAIISLAECFSASFEASSVTVPRAFRWPHRRKSVRPNRAQLSVRERRNPTRERREQRT